MIVVFVLWSSVGEAFFRSQDTLAVLVAISEVCAERFPQYAEQNTIVFAEWKKRNQKHVAEAAGHEHYHRTVRMFKGLFAADKLNEMQLKEACASFASGLSKPESDVDLNQ